MESTGFRGTRTVPVPGNGETNIQGTGTVAVQEVGNQLYKVLEWSSSGTQVLE